MSLIQDPEIPRFSKQFERTGFARERHLVDAFAPLAVKYVSESFRYHRREVEVGASIADVVAWGCSATPRDSVEIAMRRLTLLDVAALAHLLWRSLPESHPEPSHTAPAEFAASRVHVLERAGLAVRGSRRQMAAAWKNLLPSRVLAFEAKLTNWREALKQAECYSRHVDASWIVLPSRLTTNSRLVTECEAAGIGLLRVGIDHVTVELQPRTNVIHTFDRLFFRLRLLWDQARRKSV